MALTLNHTILPASNKEAAARQFAELFGLAYEGVGEHFASVKVNDTLTFLFDDDTKFESHHYAFHVSEAEFDGHLSSRPGRGAHLRESALERR